MTDRLHLVICHNDSIVTTELSTYISERFSDKVKIIVHNNTFSFLSFLEDEYSNYFDALLIDISFDNQGIDVAQMLKERFPNIKVIFSVKVLNREQLYFVSRIFDVSPSYLIFEPIRKKDCIDAIYKIIQEKDENDLSTFSININGKKEKRVYFRTKDIYYIESDMRKAYFHLNNDTKCLYIKLNDIEDILPSNFIRVHQSYIVNMDKIKAIGKEELELYDDILIPISRSKKKLVIEHINEYLFKFNE